VLLSLVQLKGPKRSGQAPHPQILRPTSRPPVAPQPAHTHTHIPTAHTSPTHTYQPPLSQPSRHSKQQHVLQSMYSQHAKPLHQPCNTGGGVFSVLGEKAAVSNLRSSSSKSGSNYGSVGNSTSSSSSKRRNRDRLSIQNSGNIDAWDAALIDAYSTASLMLLTPPLLLQQRASALRLSKEANSKPV